MRKELIEAAETWAAQRSRPLDTDLLAPALELRENHDDYPASYWPPRSAERLLLVTLPAYGHELPDPERLTAALDTFWGGSTVGKDGRLRMLATAWRNASSLHGRLHAAPEERAD